MSLRTLAVLVSALLLAPSLIDAQPATATIRGVTTAQGGSTLLPGVTITVINLDTGQRAGTAVSDGVGRFAVGNLPPGRYRVTASLAGFDDAGVGPVVLVAGRESSVSLDLSPAAVSETVKVVGEAGSASLQPAAARDTVAGAMADILPVAGDGLRSMLPVLPGVVRAPDGRISLKGARPTQGAIQLDQANASDPSTGNFGIDIPTDAVASVGLAPNLYAAESGRYSSSLVRVETRTGGNTWRATANTFIPVPCLTLCDGESWGFRNYVPRAWVGGPIVKNRLYLSQSLEFRFNKTRVPALQPPDNMIETYTYDLFTRIDATPDPRHAVSASLAFFPRDLHYVNMNTFNHEPVTANIRLRGYSAAASDTITLSPSLVANLNVSATRYHTTIDGQGTADMEVTPEQNLGNYFNTQDRRTDAFQATGSITAARSTSWGDHLVKAGFDLLRSGYEGTSLSRPVLIRRADGTLSQRIDFGNVTTTQAVSGTDVALFVQDQWRIGDRVRLQPGLRVDRDAVIDATNLSPRVGGSIDVRRDGSSVVIGGVGVFYERTPLNVDAFATFEPQTITLFATDGQMPTAPAQTYRHTVSPLEVPRATIWNVEYDHRFARSVFLKLNYLHRDGSREFIVSPSDPGEPPELRLASSGRSRYEETEATVRVGATDARHVAVTYVRSLSSGNLNAYDLYFGNLRNPIIRPDEYSRVAVDVPHRVVARAVVPLPRRWVLSPMVEVRSGFPHSIVDEDQNFVGPRNAGGRFPVFYTIDFNLLRHVTIKKREAMIGVRVWHLLNSFMPRDVQANIDSPAFGSFYNTIPRRIHVVFQLTAMSGELAK